MINIDSQSIHQFLSSRPCKIAYLGNSVTAQKNGYREHLHELICKSTQQPHVAINAGIGGVGSLASAFLLSDFVLRQEPDLCFIECAIADSEYATPRELIQSSIDSILWQLSQANISACMIYLYKNKQPQIYRQILQECYGPVVDHYNISIINIYPRIQEMIGKNQYQASELLTDGIHTTELGARLSAELILKALLAINSPVNLSPTIPWCTDSFLLPQIIKLDNIGISTSGEIVRGKFKLIIPYLEISHGSTLLVAIEDGEVIGVLLVADDHSGVIEIKSATLHHTTQVHDEYCGKARMQVVILSVPIKANETFSIKLSKCDIAKVSANLQPSSWIHLGINLKIIGLLVNRSKALLKPNYLW
jgi:lysophospholipase L1-like esterase